jgi:GMP synthase (glutamine-hydrolysing)
MGQFLILKMGTTMPELCSQRGDFEVWLAEGLGLTREQVTVVEPYRGDRLPSPELLRGVAITGSHSMVSDREPWSECCAEWLVRVMQAQVPTLGICYGHQLLAHALGGLVDYNPRGREVGTIQLELTTACQGDPLFGGLPTGICVNLSHRQCVIQPPQSAAVLATSQLDAHSALRLNETTWGLQFHPEFDQHLTRAYLTYAAQQDPLGDFSALLASAKDTPYGIQILRRFAALAGL